MIHSKTDRISTPYHQRAGQIMEHYTHMFLEDFSLRVDSRYSANEGGIECELTPENLDFKKYLIEALPSQYKSFHPGLKDAITGVIQLISTLLVHHGRAVFEMVKSTETDKEVVPELVEIQGAEVKVEKDFVIQIIPKGLGENGITSSAISIPREKCFVIDFPASLGGKNKYLKFLEDFKDFAKQTPMLNFINNPLREQADYDIIEHQRLHELELWKKSRVYSWHHRHNSELFSSYYYVFRALNFKRNQILLRDFIIEELKNIVATLSERVGERVELTISGLVSIQEMDEKIEQLKSGDLTADKIGALVI